MPATKPSNANGFRNLVTDNLDVSCCLSAVISQGTDLLSNNCKSLTCFTCSCSLNRSIEGKEVCLGCNIKDNLGKLVDLADFLTVFN